MPSSSVSSSAAKSVAGCCSTPCGGSSARWMCGFMAKAVYHLCLAAKAIREGASSGCCKAVEKQGGTGGMAVGALIGAYQESDNGELRALLPLAGRTLIEYQARCAAAAGAAPIVVMVERVPPALHEAIERLRGDGLSVIPVSDGNEAASRFEPGSLILLLGDGV